MADDDTFVPDKSTGALFTELMWDTLKDGLNAARRYRLLGIYTTGTITYNGSNSLAWTADIKILFMATDSDTYYINTITSASSPFTTSDDQIIWFRVVNSTSNVTLNDSTVAAFDRAGDLVGTSGDVVILGFTDTTAFHFLGTVYNQIRSHIAAANPHSGSGDTKWTADNSAVTGYYRVSAAAVAQAAYSSTSPATRWILDDGNGYAEYNTNDTSIEWFWIGINLTEGAKITAFRTYGGEGGSRETVTYLYKRLISTGAKTSIASNAVGSLGEISTTGLTEVVDNDLNGYEIGIYKRWAGQSRIRGFQIDYTVVRPQP